MSRLTSTTTDSALTQPDHDFNGQNDMNDSDNYKSDSSTVGEKKLEVQKQFNFESTPSFFDSINPNYVPETNSEFELVDLSILDEEDTFLHAQRLEKLKDKAVMHLTNKQIVIGHIKQLKAKQKQTKLTVKIIQLKQAGVSNKVLKKLYKWVLSNYPTVARFKVVPPPETAKHFMARLANLTVNSAPATEFIEMVQEILLDAKANSHGFVQLADVLYSLLFNYSKLTLHYQTHCEVMESLQD